MSITSVVPPGNSRFMRWGLPVLISAHIALALFYAASVPAWEAVDEAGHFQYIKYLRDHRSLPYQPDNAQQLVLSHWFHPPLYYALGAILTAGVDISDYEQVARPNRHFVWVQGDAPGGWNVFLPAKDSAFPPQRTLLALYLLRFASIAMGAATVWMVFQLAILLVPDCPSVAFGATAITALNPAFIYMMAGVQNDTLSALFGAAILWWSARAVTRPPLARRDLITGGLLLGLALLTKTSALASAPIMASAAGLSALDSATPTPLDTLRRIDRRSIHRAVGAIGTIFGLAALVAGWWYVRNQIVYGDALAWQRYMVTHHFLVLSHPYGFSDFRAFASQLARTSWAAFGYMNMVVDRPVYLTLWAVSALAALGLLRLVSGGQLRRTMASRWPAWLITGAGLVAYAVSLTRYSMALGGVGHGRLIFPVIGAASILMAVGLYSFPPRIMAVPTIVACCLALGVFAAVCPFLYIRPAYAVPQPVAAQALPASLAPNFTFGNGFRLLGAQISPPRVEPGGQAKVRLLWESSVSEGPDLVVTLSLRDRNGGLMFQKERRPLQAHLPTDLWRPGAVYEDVYTLIVPANAYTGNSTVTLQVRPPSGEPFGATDQHGQIRGTEVPIAELAVFKRQDSPDTLAVERQPSHPISAQFGTAIQLLGFDIDSTAITRGGTIRLVLYWDGEREIRKNYTVFAHLADSSGRPVAQHDSEPANGNYPTSIWQPSEIVVDTHVIEVPPDAPAGEYRLIVGMYDHDTGIRLPATGPSTIRDQNSTQLILVSIR